MSAVRRTLIAAPLLVLAGVTTLPAHSEEPAAKPADSAAPAAAPAKLTATYDGKTITCREQAAQSFLIRSN